MKKFYIKVERIPYEEPNQLRLIIDVSNGETFTKMKIYCNATDLSDVGKALKSFSNPKDDSYTWELGSETENDRFAFYFLFRVSAVDSLGYYAIHFRYNKNQSQPDDGLVEFSIKAPMQSIIELGKQFENFSKLESTEFEWTM